MRLAPLLLLFLTTAACGSEPAFPVPAGPPLPVALDAQFRFYTMGTWAIDSFDDELASQLRKYNMVVVDRRAAPHLVAEIDLGVLANPNAVDVYLVRDGARTVGRVRVPDLAPTTLEASAQLVAGLARNGRGLGNPDPLRRAAHRASPLCAVSLETGRRAPSVRGARLRPVSEMVRI